MKPGGFLAILLLALVALAHVVRLAFGVEVVVNAGLLWRETCALRGGSHE
jgi:hypothetical protein